MDRGNGPDPAVYVDVRRGSGRQPGVGSEGNLLLCYMCLENGANLTDVADDIRSLKAGLNFVVPKTSHQADDLANLLRRPDVISKRPNGEKYIRFCRFTVVQVKDDFGGGLFCGRPGAVRALKHYKMVPVPGGGCIHISDVQFGPPVCGMFSCRVAILQHDEQAAYKSNSGTWRQLALSVRQANVNILVVKRTERGRVECGESSWRAGRLVTALTKIISTTVIAPENGSPFFICLFGNVGCIRGPQENVKFQPEPLSPFHPGFASIKIKDPQKRVDKLCKGILSLNGSSSTRREVAIVERAKKRKQNQQKRRHQ